MSDPTNTTLHSAIELLEAIEDDQLRLHYQAIFAVPERRIDSFEALLRWQHPVQGLLLPMSFLPADMDSGLGWVLTNYVLEEAVRACATWQRAGIRAGVSVNVSPGRLADEFLPEHLAEVLERHQLDAGWLTIEMTESRCDVGADDIRRACVALAGLGVRLSIDDFGTGEATLTRLRHLQFDQVKIDRCFVAGAVTDPTDRSIASFATELAHSLGMTVVAEGVETAEMLDLVVDLGVDLVQGFHLHRPRELEDHWRARRVCELR
jgi:EAL domain-containing protein (putative c-di-GMP-specific phosphodiesterase class I)